MLLVINPEILYIISFFQYALIGLVLAMPLGPVGAMCMQRTLARGKWAGLLVGLGAASADSLCAFIAASSSTYFGDFFKRYEVQALCITFLLIIGAAIKMWHNKPKTEKTPHNPIRSALFSYFVTFVMVAGNPFTILGSAALLLLFHMEKIKNQTDGILLLSGIFTGSMAWWLLLSMTVSFIGHRLSEETQIVINRILSIVFFGFGIFALFYGMIKM
jgi:putative LysE/RhtB family amino acid efflux pump